MIAMFEGPRRRATEHRDEVAALQLIELHSIPASQGRIAAYRISEDQSGGGNEETAGNALSSEECALASRPLQELMSLPGGKHDDACDALGLIGQMFTTLLVGQRPKQKPKVPDSGYRPFANVTEMEQEPSVVKQIDDAAFLQGDGRVVPQSVFSR